MKKILKRSIVLALLLSLSLGATAFGKTLTGEEILTKVDQTMGAESKVMKQRMTIVAANGQERTREMQMWSRQASNGDEMLAKFLAPGDVRGTGILMKDEDMWLYLPALGKTRRVAAHAKKGSFMGSDLTFDDMEQLGSRGFAPFYEPQFLGEEEVLDVSCFVLKLTPLDEENAFSYVKMWVEKDIFLPRQIEYYNVDDEVLRELTTWNLREEAGRWRAERMVMEDLTKGSKTILEVQEVDFEQSLDASIFTTRNLERGI